MSKSKHTLIEAALARMSLGAVPMDGIYWFDPKAIREHAAKAVEKSRAEQGGCAQENVHERHGN
jgi:hypothetical protein